MVNAQWYLEKHQVLKSAKYQHYYRVKLSAQVSP